jgi:hypothetical protein
MDEMKEIMMNKKLWTGMAVALMALSAAVASADDKVIQVDTDYGTFPAIADGRINGFDIGAPAVVYYTYADGKEPGTDGAIPTGIVVLGINQESNNGYPVLEATSDDIASFLDGSITSLSDNGYTLNYTDSGWFWISTPADSEGKVYTFSWENTAFQPE